MGFKGVYIAGTCFPDEKKIFTTKIQARIKFNIKYANGDTKYEFVTFDYPFQYYTQRNVFPTLPFHFDNVDGDQMALNIIV